MRRTFNKKLENQKSEDKGLKWEVQDLIPTRGATIVIVISVVILAALYSVKHPWSKYHDATGSK